MADRKEKLRGCRSRIGFGGEKGVERARGLWRIKKIGCQSFLHHDLDFSSVFAFAPAATLHNTVAFNSGSQARHIYRKKTWSRGSATFAGELLVALGLAIACLA